MCTHTDIGLMAQGNNLVQQTCCNVRISSCVYDMHVCFYKQDKSQSEYQKGMANPD